MSRVILLRHAKAVHALPGMRDFDRPLDPRGREMAARLGVAMASQDLLPELVIASPSARTRQTLAAAAQALAGMPAADFDEALYDGDGNPYLDAIRRAGAAASVMLVGHNPMTEETALLLCGSGESQAMGQLRMGFPTGGLAVIDLPGPLSEVQPKSGHLALFMTGDAG